METVLQAANNRDHRAMIEEKLLQQRTVLIYGGINQDVAREVTEKLFILSAESNDEIKIYINSQGGHVESGDTIFDMIRFCTAPVKVIGTGWVASAGALIYSAPPVENRLALPHTRFMIHQPLGGVQGSASDLEIEAREIIKMRQRLDATFAEATGQPLKRVSEDSERNYWMSAQEGIDYGLVGRIVETEKDI